jgi:ABC-type transport system involved in cytochrome c biogenesis permease component
MTIAGKDWRVYWRYPMNAFSSITQPIIWIIPVYFMGQAFSVNGKAVGFEAYSGTSDYISFALLGMALNNFILAVFWGMGYSIKNDMVSGVLESNWLTPMPRPLLLVGRTFASLAFTTITSLAMLALAALLLGFHPTGNVLAFISGAAAADRPVWVWDCLCGPGDGAARRQHPGGYQQLCRAGSFRGKLPGHGAAVLAAAPGFGAALDLWV